MSQQQQQQPIIPVQISDDTYLYEWTASYVARLTRRNKISSPPLQLPEFCATRCCDPARLRSCKLVLLRGLGRHGTEGDEAPEHDPVGLFLQCQFSDQEEDNTNNTNNQSLQAKLSCKLSVTCTTVREHCESFSSSDSNDAAAAAAGAQEGEGQQTIVVFTPNDNNCKGIRDLLPASALNVVDDESNRNQEENQQENAAGSGASASASSPTTTIAPRSSSSSSPSPSREETKFAEHSPVEFQVQITFIAQNSGDGGGGGGGSLSSTGGEDQQDQEQQSAVDQAVSFFGGLTSTATTTLGTWFSSAVETGRERVLPSVRAVVSKVAGKAETLANQLMDRNEEIGGGAGNEQNNNNNNNQQDNYQQSSSSAATTAAGAGAAASASSSSSSTKIKAPWEEIPPTYQHVATSSNSSAAAILSPERWRNLITNQIVRDCETTFVWAPESAYGPAIRHQEAQRAAALANLTPQQEQEMRENPKHPKFSPSRISELRPQYPDFTFSPEEELALTQIGLSPNNLVHCNDSYSFDRDVEPHFVDPRDAATAELRRVRLLMVPRVVAEEKFWACYLWRVACLALCATAEQEAVVKTLLCKPCEPVIRAPPSTRTQQNQNQQHVDAAANDEHDQENENNNSNNHTSSSMMRSGSASPPTSSTSSSSAKNRNKNSNELQVPNMDALARDTQDALDLLNDVSGEHENADDGGGGEKSPPSSPLVVACIRGGKRCRDNLVSGVRQFDERVLTQTWLSAKERAAHEASRARLVEMTERITKAIEDASACASDGAGAGGGAAAAEIAATDSQTGNIQNEKSGNNGNDATGAGDDEVDNNNNNNGNNTDDEANTDAAAPAVTSPPPREPTPPRAAAATTSTTMSTSQSRPQVLMPWEEEDDE